VGERVSRVARNAKNAGVGEVKIAVRLLCDYPEIAVRLPESRRAAREIAVRREPGRILAG
jgi:hypothetical protein